MIEAIKAFLMIVMSILAAALLAIAFNYTYVLENNDRVKQEIKQTMLDKCTPVCYPYLVYKADPCTCDARYFRMEPNK